MSYITKDLIKGILEEIERGGVVGNGYASMFDCSGGNLFRNTYGIRKNGEEKGIAISLTSKYLSYTTLF